MKNIIWVVIFAIIGLTVVQGYLLYMGIERNRVAFDEKMDDLMLEIHHAIEDNKQLSDMLIEILVYREGGIDVPEKLISKTRALATHKIDSVSRLFGIYLNFDFVIYNTEQHNEIYFKSSDHIDRSEHFQRLSERAGWRIKNALGEGKYRVGLHYHNEYLLLLKDLKYILILSAILIVLLVFSFYKVYSEWSRQKRLSEIKNEFINNLVHELKTPVFSVSLLHKVIKNKWGKTLSPGVKKLVNLLESENTKIKQRIEKVVDISLIENKKMELTRENYNVHQIIKEATQVHEFLIEEKDGKILYDFQAENPICKIDRVHISGVINNLVDNAIKYSNNTPQIEISTRQQNGHVVVKIKDNGIGISEKYTKMIFDKFFRVPTGNIHLVKGMGLGLSYVKMILDAHEGSININSTEGMGSEFILNLPLQN